MKKHFFISLSLLLVAVSAMAQCAQGTPQSTAAGSPCSQSHAAHPFCTDENPYGITYPSGQGSTTGASFLGSSGYSCLGSTPRPAWYYMQIQDPGNLLLYITQGCDVDFVCWGPFQAASQAEFVEKLCCGLFSPLGSYSNGSHRPDNGNHNNDMGGYPSGGVVDCSYNPATTEWCYIPNAQPGEWYLLLITNFTGCNSTISFSPVESSSNATTNCNLLNAGDSNSPICEGDTLKMYCTQPVSGATYNWTAPDGTVYTTTNTTLAIPNATAALEGEWQMRMTGISQQSNVAVVYVTINALPNPSIIADSHSLCEGSSVNLSVEGASGTNYFWAVRPAGSTGNYTPFDAYTATTTYTPSESVDIALTAELNECYGAAYTTISVNPYPEIGIAFGKNPICYGEGTTITATGGGQYLWSTGATSSTISVQPEETTMYSVSVTSDASCVSDTTFTLEVYPEIIINHVEEASYCGNPTGRIIGQVTGGMPPFRYVSPTATFVDTVASNLMAGAYTITATDSVGCHKDFTATVPGIPGPTACFIFSSSDDVQMTITNCTQGQNNNYLWDFGDGNNSFDIHPSHEYSEPGSYSVLLTVSNEYGCMDSLRQLYAINGPVYIPNAFSPNGDEVNDILFVVGRTIQEENFSWYIYDRNGVIVFTSHDPKIGWDGKLEDGRKAQPGVYVYRIYYQDVNGNRFERDGQITLVR